VNDSPVTVVDQRKKVTCGDATVFLHLGDHGYVQVAQKDIPFAEVPNLITALQAALGLVTKP
jgi:uncharacterized protein YbaA (DUF1428 family)